MMTRKNQYVGRSRKCSSYLVMVLLLLPSAPTHPVSVPGFASDGVNVEHMDATLAGVGMGLSSNTKTISAWILSDKTSL